MNINQAKAVAGIPQSQSVFGQQQVLSAMELCKQGIIAARRTGNDARAAELSEAKALFKKRLGGEGCEVCGEPISRGATHCRLHLRKRALPGPEGERLIQTKKRERRIDVSPEGGWIARYGFYAGPVQKVVKRWEGKVSPSRIQEYFAAIAKPMIFRPVPATATKMSPKRRAAFILKNPHDAEWLRQHDVGMRNQEAFTLRFRYVGPNDWSCIFELGQALDAVLKDKSKPDSWLIRILIWVATDREQDDWPQLAARMRQQGGPAFKVNTITQAARRLRIITPKSIQAAYRRSRPIL